MFEVRVPTKPEPMGSTSPRPLAPGDDPKQIAVFGRDGDEGAVSEGEAERKRHASLMDVLHDEGDRQQEERYHMAIDEDYNDGLHWRPEDAAALEARGQAPLVFNEGRQTIEWISGMEKRLRKDYKVQPREPGDENGAELKTKLLKYTDDINMTPWVRSQRFKQAVVAGVSYLEEAINPNPEEEILYGGGEDWRNVLRDSRSRDIMQRDARVMFRRKTIDLDYACALFEPVRQESSQRLMVEAYRRSEEAFDDEGPWYLGQKLTSASEMGVRKASSFEERGAYMQNPGYFDSGRRLSVDLVEAWYRVPQSVEVFVGGNFDGQLLNKDDPRMMWEKKNGAWLRNAVRMRMRVMLCTENTVLWDGDSPFRHGQFSLIPIFAYRRARDGQAYGVWRGMRDLSDDTNKRRSKALWSLSLNRIIADEDAVDDPEALREEAAKPDAIIFKKRGAALQFVENTTDVRGNLDLAAQNLQAMRNIGGVTDENLGLGASSQSGKAILAKQDQGSLTTAELFDNLLIAIKQAGKLRLSHMEQFWTERKAVRITGKSKPIEWVVINEFDPETGAFQNDITQRQADFEVDAQDYRSHLAQAALEQMFDLLGKIATFAPQVVLNVLDLVVQNADIEGKEEWVNRIRKLNGQRDPSKPLTPAEQAEDQMKSKDEAQAAELVKLMGEAELKLKQGLADKATQDAMVANVEAAVKRMDVMMSSLEAAGIVMQNPHAIDAADEISTAAGLDTTQPSDALNAAQRGMPAAPAPDASAGLSPPPGDDAGGGVPPMSQNPSPADLEAPPAASPPPELAAPTPTPIAGVQDLTPPG